MHRKSHSKRHSRRLRSRSKVRIPIKHEGSLTALGYHLDATAENRRAALRRALKSKKVKYASLMGKLNAIAVFNKNRNKPLTRKIRSDMKFLEDKLKKLYSKSAIRRSRSASKRKAKSRRRSRKRLYKSRSTKRQRFCGCN